MAALAGRRAWLTASAALLGASLRSASADGDVGWDLLATSMGDEVQRTCFKTSAMPGWALGAFFISGPARFEEGGYRFRSIFDGYGRVNRFEIRDGEACYTSKWMNTHYFREAERLGRISNGPTFYGTVPERPSCPLKHPFCGVTGGQFDNNWVWMFEVGGEGLMTTDSPFFVRLDLESLNTTGFYRWRDDPAVPVLPPWLPPMHMPAVGSSHPVLRPKTKSTYVEILLEAPMAPFSEPMVGIYTIDSDVPRGMGSRKKFAQVRVKHFHYFHSFGVSEHYVVLPCNLGMGMPKSGLLLDAFREVWDGIRVVDLQGGVQVFDTEKFFHAHIANTFENATGIVMDLGAYPKNPFAPSPVLVVDLFENKTARDTMDNRADILRLHLHMSGPRKGQVTRESLQVPGRTADFFKINPAFNGLLYCFLYATEWFHDDDSYASMAIMKHDLCRGTRTYWHKLHVYPGEPVFIENTGAGAAEDDGLVVFVALNGGRRASDFVILDATTMAEIDVVQLPVHIPFTAHGAFIPAAKMAMAAAREGGNLHAGLAAAAAEAAVVV